MKYIRQTAFLVFAITVSICSLVFHGGSVPAVSEEDCVKLPVLMYHQVLDLPSKLGKYVVSPAELEADMKLLADRGYETVTVNDLIDYCDGKRNLPKKPVMLTFDDGYETDYVNVFPLLKKYNMRAVFSVVGSYAEKYSEPNINKHINYAHLSWDEMREMSKSGLCEFQNHSYDMHSLKGRRGALKKRGENDEHYLKTMEDDIKHSQTLFYDNLGMAPKCFTYPFGSEDDKLREIIKTHGFSASLGTYEKVNVLTGSRDELYDIRRYNRAHGRNIEKILAGAE